MDDHTQLGFQFFHAAYNAWANWMELWASEHFIENLSQLKDVLRKLKISTETYQGRDPKIVLFYKKLSVEIRRKYEFIERFNLNLWLG